VRYVPLGVMEADGKRWPSMMIAVVNYTIFTNASFTTGYFLPESLPWWFMARQLLVDYLLAFGIATAVHFIVFPTTSRTAFLVDWNGLLLI